MVLNHRDVNALSWQIGWKARKYWLGASLTGRKAGGTLENAAGTWQYPRGTSRCPGEILQCPGEILRCPGGRRRFLRGNLADEGETWQDIPVTAEGFCGALTGHTETCQVFLEIYDF